MGKQVVDGIPSRQMQTNENHKKTEANKSKLLYAVTN